VNEIILPVTDEATDGQLWANDTGAISPRGTRACPAIKSLQRKVLLLPYRQLLPLRFEAPVRQVVHGESGEPALKAHRLLRELRQLHIVLGDILSLEHAMVGTETL
jgi:hypothetical protein